MGREPAWGTLPVPLGPRLLGGAHLAGPTRWTRGCWDLGGAGAAEGAAVGEGPGPGWKPPSGKLTACQVQISWQGSLSPRGSWCWHCHQGRVGCAGDSAGKPETVTVKGRTAGAGLEYSPGGVEGCLGGTGLPEPGKPGLLI